MHFTFPTLFSASNSINEHYTTKSIGAWGHFCQLQQWQPLFHSIWQQIWGFTNRWQCLVFNENWRTFTSQVQYSYTNTQNSYIQATMTMPIKVNLPHLSKFQSIWEQIWVSFSQYLSITLMTVPISQNLVTFGNKSEAILSFTPTTTPISHDLGTNLRPFLSITAMTTLI